MELSLRLDTLGLVEIHYLRTRERYRDWPSFLLLAASRQARVLAYLSRETVEQLHQQILAVEEAAGLDADDEDDDDEGEEENAGDELNGNESTKPTERESNSFSPAFAQTLERLNELARQRLPADAGSASSSTSSELEAENEMPNPTSEEEAALEQLQDAFVQMMEVVRELAEELSTDALKLTSRFRCVRTNIGFTQAEPDDDEDEEESAPEKQNGGTHLELEVELALILQLFEEGRSRTDDLPAVELQLDVDDFEHLHETLDIALARDDRRSRRRRQAP